MAQRYMPPSPDTAICPACMATVAVGAPCWDHVQWTILRVRCPCGALWSEERDGATVIRYWAAAAPASGAA